MEYTCKLESVSFFAYHGLYPEEQQTGGLFTVDIEVGKEIASMEKLNDLNKLFNYEYLYEVAKRHMQQTKPLIETVAKLIYDEIDAQWHPEELVVKITKPNPGGLFKSGAASITLSKK